MSKIEGQVRRNLILAVLFLGVIAFILYFYFFINPAEVVNILSKTLLSEKSRSLYIGAFISYTLFAFFSALVWRELLCSINIKINVQKAVLFTWSGLFFDALVPQLGWSGEISKTYLFSKDSHQDAGKISASVVGQKIFTITLTDIALSLGLGLLLANTSLPLLESFLITLVLALSILTVIVIYYVSIRPSATKKLLNVAIRIGLVFRRKWNPEKFRIRADGFLSHFHAGIKELGAQPKVLAKAIVYAVVSFAFEVAVLYWCFLAVGYAVPAYKVLIVFTLIGTLQTVGATVFGFGEIVMTSILTLLLIPVNLSFTVTILSRIVTLWFRLIVAYVALQWAGIQIITKKSVAQTA
jgi:uncharacterized protein (TIRG00374 family)